MNDGLIAADGRTPAVRRRFAVQIGWTLAVRLLMTANSVIAGIIVARWLGADGLGQLGVVNVVVAMAVQLGSAGLPSANTYFIAKDKSQLPSVAINSLLFATIVGALLALALTIIGQKRPDWFGSIPPDLIRIAAISIPFQLVTLIGLNIFLALGEVRRFNLLDLAGQSFVLVNALVALIILNSGLMTLVTLNTAAAVAVGVIIIVLVAKYATKSRTRISSGRFDLKLLGRTISYGLKFHISILAAALMFRADLLVVNHFHSAAAAGVYTVASQVAMMLMMLPGVIATLLFPRITAEQDLRGEITSRITRHTVFVMLLICLFAVPFSFLLPVLYGPAFSEATVLLLILLPGVYLVGIQSVFAQHFNAIGLPPVIPALWLITLLVHIVLLFILVPTLAARGAALASLLSYVIIFGLMLIYFRSNTGKSSTDTLVLTSRELRDLIHLKR